MSGRGRGGGRQGPRRGRGRGPRLERGSGRVNPPRHDDPRQGSRPPHLQQTGRIQYLNRDDLQQLAGGTSEEVIKCITENEPGFLAAYKHNLNCSHPLFLKYLIKILYHLVKSTEEGLASRVVAQILSQEGDFAHFIFHLDVLLKKMPTEQRGGIRAENPQYLNYLLEIGCFAIEHAPATVVSTFPILQLNLAVEGLIKQGESLDSLKHKVEELAAQFEATRNEEIHPQEATDSAIDEQPPEPFTTIAVLPAPEEIQYHDRKPFLRPNIIKGAYSNWDHYLDVQFRLLREDFVAPLRRGVYQHCEGNPGKRITEVRIYSHVHVLAPVCLFSGVGFQIRFDTQRLDRVKWEHSRRLIFGSLLCLSKDDFKTMVFATVVKREPKLLSEGLLTIKFEGEVNGFEINPNDDFTMVESTAYFEAYRHVLEGLQTVSRTADTMPFKRYIVECNLQDIPSPLYIRHTGLTSFNLTEALGMKGIKPRVTIIDHSTWPHVDETRLDKSQLEAVKMALTQEISVIQGPPGTGKTYIGLKIVQAFLNNRKMWDPKTTSPILVVCYTNHALDQFLEGIQECKIEGREPNIVRIGGRCKSESLANCVLAAKVQNCRSERSFPRGLHANFVQARNEMFDLKKRIDQALEELDIKEGKILNLMTLESVIHAVHRFQLTKGMVTEVGKEIEVWLDLWYPPTTDEALDQPLDDDEALARAIQQSLVGIGETPVNYPDVQAAALAGEDNTDPIEDDAQFIDVDEEARLLQDERMLEGEEIELHDQPRPRAQESPDIQPHDPQAGSESEWRVKQMSHEKRKKKIERGHRHLPMRNRQAMAVEDVRVLNERDKWRLYHYWVNRHLQQKKRELSREAQRYNYICDYYNDQQRELNNYAIKGADVIGMTTTGTAKHHYILKNIHPKIVIVEEAAEVFESHIVTSLSPSVQQLILIGDHKQLKPKPNCYDLEKKYDLAVSLFERLAENRIPFTTLEVQHRMRPEIAELLLQANIYSHLENHESVKHYEHVLGIGKDLFFIDHNAPEKSNPDGDMRSHANYHEADYLVALCHYLLKQGYSQAHITLLTMYRGQLLELKRRMRRADFEGVRVAAVDDFQGEENEIILLSLVRSNSDGDIGFLKIENRVCVSLSRAKRGLYVIGNFSMLRDKDQTVWPQILAHVDQKGCMGRALPLYCQLHPDQRVAAKTAEDFSKCPEGGCQKQCNTRLQCGHTCTRLCHPSNREHKGYKCNKQCTKVLSCGHKCESRCFQCIEKCQPCREIVTKQHPRCNHDMDVQCHMDPSKVPCQLQCTKLLQCGHFCQETCSWPCTVRCMVPVDCSLPCGHKLKIHCHQNPREVSCPEPCKKLLDCGHECSGTCGECQGGRLHIQCWYECGRQLVCGHICKFPCTANCPPCTHPCNNSCVHSHCPKKCYEPCDLCMEPCQWQCQHFKCTARCGERCNRPPCDLPCPEQLLCGHPCIGLCGEICPKKCRVCDREEVGEIFFGNEDEPDARFIELRDCGHIFEVEGLDTWVETHDEGDPNEVQFKVCPKCKIPIRKSLRYSNTIKKTLADMEQIKKKQLVIRPDTLREDIRRVRREIEASANQKLIEEDLQKIEATINPPTDAQERVYLFPHRINAITNQLTFLSQVVKLHDTLNPIKVSNCKFSSCTIEIKELHHAVHVLQAFFMQDFLSDQQLSDIESELQRLMCITRLCDLEFKIVTKKSTVSSIDRSKLDQIAAQVFKIQCDGRKLTPEIEEQVSVLIAHFHKKYAVGGLTKAERVDIVKAIGLTKGHWFKCPNGHFYCIGECGGATEIAKCPECGAKIGGTNHQLLQGNQLAPEMDGATYAAWSTDANLANYDLNELQRHFGI